MQVQIRLREVRLGAGTCSDGSRLEAVGSELGAIWERVGSGWEQRMGIQDRWYRASGVR